MAQYNRHMYPTIICTTLHSCYSTIQCLYQVSLWHSTGVSDIMYNQFPTASWMLCYTFDLLNPNSKQFAYIHLRAISCNETLFTTSIGNIFSNRNNIQPTFTPRQLAEGKISSCLFFQFSHLSLVSSATIIFSTSTILLPDAALQHSLNDTPQPVSNTDPFTK